MPYRIIMLFLWVTLWFMDGLCVAEFVLKQELYCCVMKGQRKAGDLRSDFVCSCKNSWWLCVLVVKEKHCVLHDQVAERTVSFCDLMSFGELEKKIKVHLWGSPIKTLILHVQVGRPFYGVEPMNWKSRTTYGWWFNPRAGKACVAFNLK